MTVTLTETPSANAGSLDQLVQTHRIALVLHPDLDRGAVGNRCAVLATGLAAHHPEIIGTDLVTKDGLSLPGFTKVPIAVLAGRDQSLHKLASRARALGCTTLVFLSRAQGMRSYDAYAESITQTVSDELDVDAFAIFGTKKAVNSLVGALPCLR